MPHAVHICGDPPPDLSVPDWPRDCPERPADARELGYNAWHEMAAARGRRGERSVRCPHCERWTWASTPCSKLRSQE